MSAGFALLLRRGRPAAATIFAIVAAALAAPGGGQSRASLRTANPIQIENASPGNSGWQLPPDTGKVITGYASETSAVPGETVHLHVSAPRGDRYRVELYRLGWYQGVGGRLVMCVPGCGASRRAVSQQAPTAPDPSSHLFYAPWSVTDALTLPLTAVSGYYEARLEVVGGSDAGAVGMVPLIVREPQPRAAVLVQVPVNTWQAYNSWGGRSLYGKDGTHATEVSFDRPYDAQVFHDMALNLELPWVHFLERSGVDVAYQTDVDTDADPDSLLGHRLVFSSGHDEYWTQGMRDAFTRARAHGTNMMFGSNSGLWRMRYDDNRRTIVEWRNPNMDPARDWRLDTGEFRQFGEPECRLMAVQYEDYAQRWILAKPTDYTVVGAATDPWLAAAGLKPGDVVPGVVGYEWDSFSPHCFPGRVTQLMHGVFPGSDGAPRSADLVRATAHSGAQVFAMGTMQLGWALDDFTGQTPDPRVEALVTAALQDLQRPAPPARLIIRRSGRVLVVSARLRAADPRILRVSVRIQGVRRTCRDALHTVCLLPVPRGRHRRTFLATALDRWGRSRALVVKR